MYINIFHIKGGNFLSNFADSSLINAQWCLPSLSVRAVESQFGVNSMPKPNKQTKYVLQLPHKLNKHVLQMPLNVLTVTTLGQPEQHAIIAQSDFYFRSLQANINNQQCCMTYTVSECRCVLMFNGCGQNPSSLEKRKTAFKDLDDTARRCLSSSETRPLCLQLHLPKMQRKTSTKT